MMPPVAARPGALTANWLAVGVREARSVSARMRAASRTTSAGTTTLPSVSGLSLPSAFGLGFHGR